MEFSMKTVYTSIIHLILSLILIFYTTAPNISKMLKKILIITTFQKLIEWFYNANLTNWSKLKQIGQTGQTRQTSYFFLKK